MRTKWTGEVVAQIDMLLSLAIVLLALSILVTPVKKEIENDKATCGLAFDMTWTEQSDADVDIHAKAPGDRIVSYRNHNGLYLDLIRDDRGYKLDSTKINAERVCSRGIPRGEWIVNVHLYTLRQVPPPIKVKVAALQLDPNGSSSTLVFEREVVLRSLFQEITVMRFNVDDRGRVIESTINDIPVSLVDPEE